MSKISCGLSIDMLAPYIEDVLMDNPSIGVEGGTPLSEVYRQTFLDIEDLVDDFRGVIRNISNGVETDHTELITTLIPANITIQHAIKSAKDENFEMGTTGLKVYRRSMQDTLRSLVETWDSEVESTGTSGTSMKDENFQQAEMPDGDAPVGNIDVDTPVKTVSEGFQNISGKKVRRSMDSIIRESLGDELIEKAPQLMEMMNDVVSHAVADTRVIGKKARFTMNKRKIRNEILNKLREAVTVFYENNAIAIGSMNSLDRTSKLPNNAIVLTREQLPTDAESIFEQDDYSVFSSKSVADKYGKPKMLIVGEYDKAPIRDIIEVGKDNPALTREYTIESGTDPVLNAYIAKVLLTNFRSVVDNMVPYLKDASKENHRTDSVEPDSISGNQAKDITRLNITTTPKLAAPSKGSMSEVVNKLFKSIKKSDVNKVDILNESGIIDEIMDDKPLLRVRFSNGDFEDIVIMRVNNTRYPLVLDRETKKWNIITNVDPNVGLTVTNYKLDTDFIEEAPLLDMLDYMSESEGLKETRNIFGPPTEVNAGAVFVNINNVAKSMIAAKNDVEIVEVSNNTYNKFLAEEELESLSEIFLNLPQDISDAGLAIKERLSKTHGAEAEILRGLYFRFFKPEEYFITRRNPITGKTETQPHQSFYRISKLDIDSDTHNGMTEAEKSLAKGRVSRQAKEQLVALKSMLNTVAPNEFINMINGSAVMSNTLNGDTLRNNFESIDFKNVIRVGDTYFTNDEQLRLFKVKDKPKDPGVLEITFKPGMHEKKLLIKTETGSIGGGSFTKLPFTIKDDSGWEFRDYEDMLRTLHLPTKFATQEFLSLTGGTGGDIAAIKDFITTIVGVKLANGHSSGRHYIKANAQALAKKLIPETLPNSPTYPISRHVPRDYKDTLKGVLDQFEGLAVRKFVTDHERNKRMTTATVNKALRIAQVIKEAKKYGETSIYMDSEFVQGNLTIDGTYSKNGIINGREGKSNKQLSTKEQFKFLVEGAFLDATKQKNFTQAAFHTSTKADRSSASLPLVGRADGKSFLPQDKTGNLDRNELINNILVSQRNFYKSLDNNIISQWVGTGTKFGKGVLKRIYDRDLQINDTDGNRVIITKEMIRSDQTLQQLASTLKDLRLDFNQVSRIGGIAQNLGISKVDGAAGIRPSTLRMSEIMQNTTQAKAFIEANRLMFHRGVNKLFEDKSRRLTGYVPEQRSIATIEDRFGKMSFKDAKDTILDSFFYNDILVSNELSRFETGPIEQYKIKLQPGPIESEIFPGQVSILDEVYGKKDSEKVKFLKNKLKDYSYDDLVGDTRLGLAKRILEDNFMTAKQQVFILEFDDVSSQLSPAYVEQVKRNQGVGTSLQMFAKVSATEAGAYVGESTKCVTIDDPTFLINILGTSGSEQVDIYDATTIMHPAEMIKYNNSLGNRMSNFSSKGGAFKDANVSSTAEGYYVYQKKASQPLFGTEFLVNGEHGVLNKKMNTAISFGHVPMYVENVNNESIEEGTQNINYESLMKHGESLERLETQTGDKVHAETLIFKVKNNEITPDEINNLGLTTDKVLKQFNNLQDVWDHFGGLEGDYNRLKTNPDEKDHYLFGYGMHKAIDVMSNYRGDGTYPLRDSYIGKIGVASQEKTGTRSINPASSLTDNSTLEFEEVPNSDNGIILQPDHNPDTTASMSNKKQDEHDSDIKVITQILSASVGEGEGYENVKEILDTVSAVVDMEMDEFSAEIEELSEKYRNTVEHEVSDEEAKKAGYIAIAYKLTKASLQTRTDPGITGSMIFDTEANEVNFDHKAILPVLRTAVNAELNKRTVNLRFKGNQTVVTASHDQVKSYRFGPTEGLFRTTVNSIANEYINKGLDLPKGWELNPVNELDNLVDTDYVYEMTTDGLIQTTFGKFRKMNKVEGRTFKSVFSPTNKGAKSGEILKWLNYSAADGSGNLRDTPEYRKYMLANPFYEVAKFFTQEPGFNEPAVSITDDAQSSLVNNGILTQDEVDGFNEASFDEQQDLVKKFKKRTLATDMKFTHIYFDKMLVDKYFSEADYNSALSVDNTKAFITETAKDLHDVLQVPNKWVTAEAEFYVPPMHQAAFLIEDYDTLHDIIGTGRTPNTKALLVSGLINNKEFEILERKFNSTEGTDIVNRLKATGSTMVSEYLAAKKAQNDAMTAYFGGTATVENGEKVYKQGKVEKEIEDLKNLLRLKEVGKIKASDEKRLKALLDNHQILGLFEGTVSKERTLERIENIIKSPKISSIQLEYLVELKNNLELVSTAEGTSAEINRTVNKYKNFWVDSLVNNFAYTLTFISARIPASGKQSYTAARVKNFIFSTRNASYGPLELIGISGADYDIDKQNNLTWDVDIYGKVYDWLPYEDDNGKLKPVKTIKAMIEKDVKAYAASLAGSVDEGSMGELVASYRKGKIDEMSRRLQNRVVRGLMTNITDPKNAIEAATAVAMSKLKGIKRKLAEYNYSRIDDTYMLERAFKGDPEIETLIDALSAEGSTSEDLKNLKKAIDKDQLQKYADSSLQLLLEPRKHALPMSSLTKMTYERVNLDGKTGIGIFASALKGYFASYYAWIGNAGVVEFRGIVDSMRDSGELAQYGSIGEATDEIVGRNGHKGRMSPDGKEEFERLEFTTPYIKKTEKGRISSKSPLSESDLAILGDDFNEKALQIVALEEDGTYSLKNITTLANTGKWSVEGYVATSRAKEAAALIAQSEDIAEQQAIFNKFAIDTETFRSANVENQAWADLSELLNAATDNAKELILGYIGATNNTDAMISAMVVMGIDLNVALTLLNDPSVKATIKKLEDRDYLFGSSSEFTQKLAKALSGSAKRFDFDSELFEQEHADITGEELKKQRVLGKMYNPAKQLAVYATVGEELTSLSSSFLGINQGLPNADYDVFNFIRKANKSLQSGTFEEFVGDEKRREDIINKFEKVGLNVPYIVANNPHYFGQFRALNLANDIVNSVSFVSGLVRSDLLQHEGVRIDLPEFQAHVNNVYGLITDLYYNDEENNNVKLNIKDKRFDLSKVSSDGEIGGRLEFLRAVPDMVADIQNDPELGKNAFIRKLFLNTGTQDKETGEHMVRVNGPATNVMSPAEISILRANANKLKNDNPEIYNALFNYSLVIDRGGLSKGSIAQFFTADDFSNFNEFVKRGDVEKKLSQVFGTMKPEIRQLLTPSLIKSISANDNYNAAKARAQGDEPVDDELDEGASPYGEIKKRRQHAFSMGWLNKRRSVRNRKFNKGMVDTPAEDAIRIAETGVIAAWNESLQTYLPITKAKPDVSIPISIDGVQSNNDVFDITKFGYDYGWEVRVSSEFKGGKTGRIIRKTTGRRNHYDVLVDGQLKEFKKSEIANFNPGIKLNDSVIDLRRVGKLNSEKVVYYNKNVNKMTLNSQAGSYEPVILSPDLEYLYDSTDSTPYSDTFANFIENKVGKSVNKNYVLETFDKQPLVKNFRAALITSAYRTNEETDKVLTNTQIEELEEYNAIAIRNAFDQQSALQKITLLRNGKTGWEEFMKDIIPESKWRISDAEFDKKKIPSKMTQLELSYITDPTLSATLTIGETLSIAKGLINEQGYFNKALKGLGEDRVAFVDFQGNIINGNRFLPDEIKNPRIQESKDYDIPISLNEEAGKIVGPKSLKRMATVLNNKFTNTSVTVLSSEEIRLEYGDKFADLRGFVINGQIVLNQEKASLSTPIHEMGHIYLAYLKDEDSELYEYIVNESLNSEIADGIRNAYPELTDLDIGEEVFVEMLGIEHGKDLMSVSKSNLAWNNIKRKLSNNKAFGKIMDFFRTMFEWMTGSKTPTGLDFTMKDSMSTILNKIGSRIVYGDSSIFSDFSSPEKTAMKLADPYGTMTSNELVSLLTQQGYIRKVCP